MIMVARQQSSDWQRDLKAFTSKPDFSLSKDINPQELANFFTSLDIESFGRASATNIVHDKHSLIHEVVTTWDELCSTVDVSVVSDYSLLELFVETIIVSPRVSQKP
jgi:hypothetical protein